MKILDLKLKGIDNMIDFLLFNHYFENNYGEDNGVIQSIQLYCDWYLNEVWKEDMMNEGDAR